MVNFFFSSFWLAIMMAFMTGCSMTQPPSGAAGDNEGQVLVGGPVSGTRIVDLPQPVLNTLEERVPHEKIADIDKTTRDGRTTYVIRFSHSDHEKIYVMDDGELWPSNQALR